MHAACFSPAALCYAPHVKQRTHLLLAQHQQPRRCPAGLSSAPGVPGLQVAHHWLAQLLQHLSFKVSPFTSIAYVESTSAPDSASSAASGISTVPASSDPLQDLVPVLPSYARSVADELRSASAAVGETYAELPPEVDAGFMVPAVIEAYPAAAHAVDAVLADEKVSRWACLWQTCVLLPVHDCASSAATGMMSR